MEYKIFLLFSCFRRNFPPFLLLLLSVKTHKVLEDFSDKYNASTY